MYQARARGFSLLEVLVAFVVLALTATTIFRITSGALQSAALVEEYSRALLIAETKLSELGVEKRVREGTEIGVVEGSPFVWQIVVQASPLMQEVSDVAGLAPSAGIASMPVQLLQAEITVGWDATANRRRQITLSTLRLAPRE